MIIGSSIKMEVGKKYYGVVDKDYVAHPDQPFIVIAEVTFDDWFEEYKSLGYNLSKQKQILAQKEAVGFYRISID